MIGRRVVPEIPIRLKFDFLEDNGAFHPAVCHDLTNRLLAGAADNSDAELLIVFEFQIIERQRGT